VEFHVVSVVLKGRAVVNPEAVALSDVVEIEMGGNLVDVKIRVRVSGAKTGLCNKSALHIHSRGFHNIGFWFLDTEVAVQQICES